MRGRELTDQASSASDASRGISRLCLESAVYALGGALVRAISLLVLPVYTAILSPAEYGVLATMNIVAALIAPIATFGIGVSLAICYYEHADPRQRQRVVWTASLMVGSIATGVALASLIFPRLISRMLFDTETYAYGVLVALIGVAVSCIAQPLVLGLQFRRVVARYLVFSAITAVLSAAVGIMFVAFLDRGVPGVFEAQVIGNSVLLVLLAREAWGQSPPEIDAASIRPLFVRGLPMLPSLFFLLLLQQGNQFLLKGIGGLRELGVYAVGFSLGAILGVAVSGFTTAWTPFFLSLPKQGPDTTALARAMTWYALGFGMLTVLFFAWAGPVVALLLPVAYRESQFVVGCAAAAQLLSGAFAVLLPPLYYAKKVWVVTIVQGIAALVAMMINWYLIVEFGVRGAAVGLVLGYFIMCVMLYAWLRARTGRYLSITYEWGRVSASAALVIATAIFFANRQGFETGVQIAHAVGATVLAAAIFPLFLRRSERSAAIARAREYLRHAIDGR